MSPFFLMHALKLEYTLTFKRATAPKIEHPFEVSLATCSEASARVLMNCMNVS